MLVKAVPLSELPPLALILGSAPQGKSTAGTPQHIFRVDGSALRAEVMDVVVQENHAQPSFAAVAAFLSTPSHGHLC